MIDHAIASHAIGEVIFVAVDMTTPLGCSWYVNSPVTGNWEDFMIREVVPFVDANFRTLSKHDSRGSSETTWVDFSSPANKGGP